MIVSDPKQCIVSEVNTNLLQGKDNKANGVQVNKNIFFGNEMETMMLLITSRAKIVVEFQGLNIMSMGTYMGEQT